MSQQINHRYQEYTAIHQARKTFIGMQLILHLQLTCDEK